MEFLSFIVNEKPLVRRETENGTAYLVAPATIMRKGVFHGSMGPVLYGEKVLAEKPERWDKFAIVNTHPKVGNDYVSVQTGKFLANTGVGDLRNTAWVEGENRLATELWFEEKKAKKVNPTIVLNLNSGKPFNVSTGLLEAKFTGASGEWDGVKYVAELESYEPDHLAVLTNQEGACSIKHGCGVLVNDASFQRVSRAISVALEKEKGYSYYVRDVYPDYFIYSDGNGDLFKLPYTEKAGKVTFSGKPVPVQWVTEYRTMDGVFVGNCNCSQLQGHTSMNKAQQIDAMIVNGKYTEEDRGWLSAVPDAGIAKMFASLPATNPLLPAPTPAPVVANNSPGVAAVVAALSPEEREIMNEALASRSQQRAAMIANIRKHPSAADPARVTDAYLNSLPMGTLQMMASMAAGTPAPGAPATAPLVNAAPPLFTGQATTVVIANEADEPPGHLVPQSIIKKAAAAS